ncbi:TetR/AcrR family transcriptional regulator [Pseudomonas sp. NA-150]|uniref:TetR/AcrR family transcriptional regulator n=1 Tax=Pseudomonas sp. NA-150 TaxID=3367525 RepID=UPI0037C77070
MSRYTPQKAAETRQKIITTAARMIREDGIKGIAIKGVMSELGLTVGGFYLHFKSRDELVVEAIRAASTSLDRLEPGNYDLMRAVGIYLSRTHRDMPGEGCELSATVSEVSRESMAVRDAFTDQLKSRIAGFTEPAGHQDPQKQRSTALLAVASCVGALSLSRAVSDPALSQEILSEVRTALGALIERAT